MLARVAVLSVLFALAPFGARAQGVSIPSAGAALQRVSGESIARTAAQEVAAIAHDPNRELVAVASIPDQVVAAGRVTLRAESPMSSAAFYDVPVQIAIDGRVDRTVLVGYRVQRYVTSAVAAHDLVPGTVLTADDVTMARVPDTGVPANGTDALVGRQVGEAFSKGERISIAQTSVDQIVKAGSTVMLVVRDNGVAVTADVLAQTGGGMGDQVFVYNRLTHKALSGTVTGPGTVELDISGADL